LDDFVAPNFSANDPSNNHPQWAPTICLTKKSTCKQTTTHKREQTKGKPTKEKIGNGKRQTWDYQEGQERRSTAKGTGRESRTERK